MYIITFYFVFFLRQDKNFVEIYFSVYRKIKKAARSAALLILELCKINSFCKATPFIFLFYFFVVTSNSQMLV